MGIKGKQIEDDTITGDDIDESTLVIDLDHVVTMGNTTGKTINCGQIVIQNDSENELLRLKKKETESKYLVFEIDDGINPPVDKFEMYLNSFENFTFTTTDTTDDILFRLNGHTALYMNGYPKEVRIWDSYSDVYNTQINSTLEIDGEVSTKKIIAKKVVALSSATGTTVHDCSQGTIFIHDSISGTFSADFTNLNIPAGHACELKLILEQGNTAYMCDGVKINGSGKTVIWEGGSAPSGTAGKLDEVTFEILYNGTSYMILGNIKTF